MRLYGQDFGAATVARIRAAVSADPRLTRSALSRRVCEWLEWRAPNGALREMSCRKALLALHARGEIGLPSARERPGHSTDGGDATCEALAQVRAPLSALGRVELVPIAANSEPSRWWRAVLDEHHTLGSGPLRGAHNKARVAEIVSAAEYLLAHPEIEHGPIRLGFTPDEEVGNGTKFFDVEKFGAFCAYTMDGETLGHLETETFSADSLTATFQGFNTHPGFAKGKMINAIKVAADFLNRLPKDRLSPETTEGYEGFVHPYVVEAGVESTSVKFLIRDFETGLLKEKEEFLEKLARETAADWDGASVKVEVQEQYRNMGEILEKHPKIVEAAKKAIAAAGLELHITPIRGGTDGSRLSFMGLPTPNIFAGEHNFHSRLEWISIYDMHKAVEVIIELAKIWAK